jgi:hypothetical protein
MTAVVGTLGKPTLLNPKTSAGVEGSTDGMQLRDSPVEILKHLRYVNAPADQSYMKRKRRKKNLRSTSRDS